LDWWSSYRRTQVCCGVGITLSWAGPLHSHGSANGILPNVRAVVR
jgi:hypothetical protein